MDFSNQQAQDIQEIEKQVNNGTTSGPKVLSQTVEKDRSVLINALSALGITVVGTAAVIVLLIIPAGKKKPVPPATVTTTTLLNVAPNIVVQSEYVNPFAQDAQYENPFIASLNPFSSLLQ